MSKVILVTGATGKQGGSLIEQILEDSAAASQFTILAVTRDANAASSKKLTEKSSSIKLVQGNLDDCAALFKAAREVIDQPVWGVFSVQISLGKGVTPAGEIKQGCDLVDEAVKNGVEHFVYSSVERGGEERSWENPTCVEHFKTKQQIELHLRDNAGSMGWTILRPVGFMENLSPGMPAKVFLTALRDTVGTSKRLQYVSITDIGFFAKEALVNPEKWNHKTQGLAGDEFHFDGMSDAFKAVTGYPAPSTFWFLGSVLKTMVPEIYNMMVFWRDEGYNADVKACKEMNPKMLNFEEWLRTKSGWKTTA